MSRAMSDSESRSETSEREEQTIDLGDDSLIDFADPNDGVFDIQMEEDMLREQEAEEKEDDPQESKESNLKKRKSGGKKGRALGASKWSKTEIALLLETIDDKWYILKTAAKKKPVWVLIADTMELNGFSRNFTACANKWKVLRNEYQICKDANKTSGNSKISGEHFAQVDAILGERQTTRPQVLMSTGVAQRVPEVQSMAVEESIAPQKTQPHQQPTIPEATMNKSETPQNQVQTNVVVEKKKSRKERRLEEEPVDVEESAQNITKSKESSADRVARLMGEHLSSAVNTVTNKFAEQNERDMALARDLQVNEQCESSARWAQFMDAMAMQQNTMNCLLQLFQNSSQPPSQHPPLQHQNLYPRPMSASMNSQMYPPSHPPSEFAHAQGQKKCRVDSCTNSAQFGYDGEVIACAIHKFQDMS